MTWVVCLSVLTDALRAAERRAAPAPTHGPARTPYRRAPRRGFLIGAGLMAVGLGRAWPSLGRVLGAGRRQVEEARRLLRLPGVSEPEAPAGVSVDLEGVTPWRTPNEKFYLIHTALDPAGDRSEGLAAADPRDGRPRGGAHL